jgi:hypothetical protein
VTEEQCETAVFSTLLRKSVAENLKRQKFNKKIKILINFLKKILFLF